MGTCGFFARIGSVTAPFLMILVYTFLFSINYKFFLIKFHLFLQTEYYTALLPLGILSVLTLVSATLIIFLPDTRNVTLPHSISDSQELWEKKK